MRIKHAKMERLVCMVSAVSMGRGVVRRVREDRLVRRVRMVRIVGRASRRNMARLVSLVSMARRARILLLLGRARETHGPQCVREQREYDQ